RWFCPVDVIDDDEHQIGFGQMLDQAAVSPGHLSWSGSYRLATSSSQPQGDQLGLWITAQDRVDPARATLQLAQYLGERPVGDAVAVGEAAPDQGRSAFSLVGDHLADEPRLADPRLADHRHQLRLTLAGERHRTPQRSEFL